MLNASLASADTKLGKMHEVGLGQVLFSVSNPKPAMLQALQANASAMAALRIAESERDALRLKLSEETQVERCLERRPIE